MNLTRPLLAALLAMTPVAAAIAQQSLAREDEEKLRCAAAFALAARRQADGDAAALAYPPLAQRGQEYFVRAVAEVIDHTGLGDEQVKARLQQLATTLAEPGKLDAALPTCMESLTQSGL